jgi:hypothetical protein
MEIRRLEVQGHLGKELTRPHLQNTQHKRGLEQFLKTCETPNSNPSTAQYILDNKRVYD